VRRAIHADVCTHGFDGRLGSFVQAHGSEELDASLLPLPTVGFLPLGDPRIRGTIDMVERRLLVDGSSSATTRAAATTGCRAAKAHFWPAASGWRMRTC
jgi:GH15 family glucan-1,4-alpha-glucosidase